MTPRAVVVLALSALAVAALIVIARSGSGPVHRFDVTTADRLNRDVAGHPGEVRAWKVVTDIAGPSTWRVLGGAAAIILWVRRRRREALIVATALIAAAVLSGVVKDLVDRRRPVVPIPVDRVSGASFPSGHALTSFTALGLLVLLSWPAVSRARRVLTLFLAAVVAAAVGFSRLILGVHYVTDVVGGWLIGLFVLTATTLAFSGEWKTLPSRPTARDEP